MSDNLIGLIDSGAGGLSIFDAIQTLLPAESITYVADSAFAPYGNLPPGLVAERVLSIASSLVEQDVKAIVIACNTATGLAVSQLRESLAVPVVAVEPAIKPATQLSETGKIGVLATRNTVSGDNVRSLINTYGHGKRIFLQACDGLMERVEAGEWDTPETASLLKEWLDPMLAENVDTLVLGCTHYPFVSDVIRDICGPDVRLLNPADAVARQLMRVLQGGNLLSSQRGKGSLAVYSTRPGVNQSQVFCRLLGYPVQIHSFLA